MRLTEAQRRKALRDGTLLVPKDISWRAADQLVKRGLALLDPFHQRWLGRLDFTPSGRRLLSEEGRDG